MRTRRLRSPATPDGVQVSALCLGTMDFGTTVDESRAYAILDRYAEAGGTLLDTANCYSFWADGADGSESERLIGRWLADRGTAGTTMLATKVGADRARPDEPYDGHNREALSAAGIREQFDRSRERLGVEVIDLYYAHADDRSTDLAETVAAFASLVDAGEVRVLGASNYALWRLERARALAADRGLAGYTVVQQLSSYLYPRPLRVPVTRSVQLAASDELFDYADSEDLTVFAYSPLARGAYSRTDRRAPSAPVDFDHAGSERRIAVLREQAAAMGVTANQLALAWMMTRRPSLIPVLGVSSVEQLDEAIGALDVEVDEAVLAVLDAA